MAGEVASDFRNKSVDSGVELLRRVFSFRKLSSGGVSTDLTHASLYFPRGYLVEYEKQLTSEANCSRRNGKKYETKSFYLPE